VKWFRMIFSDAGMETDPDKTKLIREWPVPRTVRDVRVSYIRHSSMQYTWLQRTERRLKQS
jgi:hypothetical protein